MPFYYYNITPKNNCTNSKYGFVGNNTSPIYPSSTICCQELLPLRALLKHLPPHPQVNKTREQFYHFNYFIPTLLFQLLLQKLSSLW